MSHDEDPVSVEVGAAVKPLGVGLLLGEALRVFEKIFSGIDDGVQSVTLTVTNEHGISDTDTAEVTTVNAPPVISALTVTTTPPAQTVSVQAAFTDPGTADTHAVVADWGDGTSGPVAGGHTYADAGRYTVKVTVTDLQPTGRPDQDPTPIQAPAQPTLLEEAS